LAHNAGARVIGTGHASAREIATELGADEFVDVTDQPFENVIHNADLVLDLVGGDVIDRSMAVLKPGGVLVTPVDPPEHVRVRPDVRYHFFVVEPSRPQLRELARQLDDGELRSIVGAVVPLRDGRSAFEAKLRGGSRGKTVLAVSN
jgi:NADPH:quinone reductase-like Zn-dependent oxidoreductase